MDDPKRWPGFLWLHDIGTLLSERFLRAFQPSPGKVCLTIVRAIDLALRRVTTHILFPCHSPFNPGPHFWGKVPPVPTLPLHTEEKLS